MSNHIKLKNSELFTDLPLEEQEAVSGGRSSYSALDNMYDLLFQSTQIETFSNSEANASDGIHSFSSRQQTGYRLSQFSFGFGGGGRRRGRRSSRSSRGFLNMLFGLMSLF